MQRFLNFNLKYIRYSFYSVVLLGFACFLIFNNNSKNINIEVTAIQSQSNVISLPYEDIKIPKIKETTANAKITEVKWNQKQKQISKYGQKQKRPSIDCQRKYIKDGGEISLKIDHELQNIGQENSICKSRADSSIECFAISEQSPKNSLCILRNVMGSVIQKNDGSKHYKLLLKAKCDQFSEEKFRSFFTSKKYHLPFDVEFIDIKQQQNGDQHKNYVDNIWKVWYLDGSEECAWHKDGDKHHVGNPWHCYAHMERFFRAKEMLAKNNMNYNTKSVYFTSVLGNDHFIIPDTQHLETLPSMFGVVWPFADDIINDQSQILYDLHQNQSVFNIDQLIFYYFDEYYEDAIIWKWSNRYLKCKFNKNTRSPILERLQEYVINFYSNKNIIKNEPWLKNLFNGGFEIYLNGKIFTNDSELIDIQHKIERNEYHMIFVASRWIHGICRYRCLFNIHEFKKSVVERFSHIPGLVVLFGNSGSFGYETQYNLMRNCRMFISSHGAVFIMSALFMKKNTLQFEIGYREGYKSEHLVTMLHGYESYLFHSCKKCRCVGPGCNIRVNNINTVAVSLKIYNFYTENF